VSLDISGVTTAPPVLMNGQGQTLFIDVDQYEYAFPAMATTGSIVTETSTYEVSGISWLDRQWGDLPDFFSGAPADGGAFDTMNWMWSNLQLDDGNNIALGQVRDIANHKIYLGLTAVDPDGTHVVVNVAEPLETGEHWTSPVTGRRYPTRCVFRAPQVGAELIIEVPYKDQEIVSKVGGMTKYEGATVITGTFRDQAITGRGYLELVGRWD
jgi:predicted secreted hydrolase